jgi:hypothetical protein
VLFTNSIASLTNDVVDFSKGVINDSLMHIKPVTKKRAPPPTQCVVVGDVEVEGISRFHLLLLPTPSRSKADGEPVCKTDGDEPPSQVLDGG